MSFANKNILIYPDKIELSIKMNLFRIGAS